MVWGDGPIPVTMYLGDEQRHHLLCTLDKDHRQVPLNLVIEKNLQVKFLTQGMGFVHITGYTTTNIQEDPRTVTQIQKPLHQIDINKKNGKRNRRADLARSFNNFPENKRLKHVKIAGNGKANDESSDNTSDSDSDTSSSSLSSSRSSSSTCSDMSISDDIDAITQYKTHKNIVATNYKSDSEKQEDEEDETPAGKKNREKFCLPGGLRVIVLRSGTGRSAEKGNYASIYYRARIQLGSKLYPKIDECLQGPGVRFKIGTNEMLPGVDLGTVGMRVGEKRRLIIPPKLGYGVKGSTPTVPPFSTLVYDVELLSIEDCVDESE